MCLKYVSYELLGVSSGTYCCNECWNLFRMVIGHFLTTVPSLSSSLQDFFIAEGDGLPKGVVENAAASVQQILNLYSLDVSSPAYASDSVLFFFPRGPVLCWISFLKLVAN